MVLEQKQLWIRTFVAAVVILGSTILFAPNILPQKLALCFRKEIRVSSSEKLRVPKERVEDFINDRENGLLQFFPKRKCIPEAGDNLPATHRCILKSRFLTAADVNELVQSSPGLINSRLTRILPHPIESFIGRKTGKDHRNLKIKLGLDLQGGMRAVFRADFKSYLERMHEKFSPRLAKLQSQLPAGKESAKETTSSTPSSDPKEKELQKILEDRKRASNNAQNIEQATIIDEIRSIKRQLTLNEGRKQRLLQAAKVIIDKRLTEQNLSESEVRVQEESYSISVDMPGASNPDEVLSRIKETVTVDYRIVEEEATSKVSLNLDNQSDLKEIRTLYRDPYTDPEEIKEIMANIRNRSGLKQSEGKIFLHWRRARGNINSEFLPREFRVLGPPLLDGSEMESAWAGRDPGRPWFQIYFQLTGAGSEKFGNLTKKHVGKRMAIVWGDRVVSDPQLREPIYGGRGVISGDFSERESREITRVIQEGALPMPLELVSVSSVGPSLGRSSIAIGMSSILVGYAIVVLFMLFYYRLSGIVAVVALFLNLLIMMAIMSLLEFTFTLPGIAGMILTVGMAVDASVIIFEKIKEELHAGKSPAIAISSGFDSSLWTILDANITTLIAAIILWLPRDGPIMGFAIVLFFGLLTSMFTALYCSRLMFSWVIYLLPLKTLSIGYRAQGKSRNQVLQQQTERSV